MRRTLQALVLVATLALPAAISAAGTDGTLSVKRGRGLIVLKFKGTAIGRLANGRVRIKDATPFDDQITQFRNCRRFRYINASTAVCIGRNISFRAVDGRYAVTVLGSGIYLSAVGRGTVLVDGAGDQGVADGVMSIDDEPYQSLPDIATSFELGTTTSRR